MGKTRYITAVAANLAGEIFDLPGYAALGMAGPLIAPISVSDAIPLPHGGELMLLPDRSPLVYNLREERIEQLSENPFEPGEKLFPVAAFNSPGYVIKEVCAYEERKGAGFLPLFSYGAAGWHGDGFYSPLVRVDWEKRQDLRLMPREKVEKGVAKMRKTLPENRLRAHLERCALEYGCPAGKNFFLGRFEAPLPTASACNARCLGCISQQEEGEIPHSQDRIGFTPTPEEIAGVALTHIKRVKRAVVSFGQGCEGDPLMAAHVIEPAIRLIRKETDAGTININTNAGRPDLLEPLWDAGLDSIRVSINSVREPCCTAYFRPVGYRYSDVMTSIGNAGTRGKFISLNYLNCPGFTDTPEEADALLRFLEEYPIRMIQWRNLNYDPLRYWQEMDRAGGPHGEPLGMENLLNRIRSRFPKLLYGYFNPPKERFFDGSDPP